MVHRHNAVRIAAAAIAVSARAFKAVPPIADGALYATVAQLSVRYGVSEDWIRARKERLGGTKVDGVLRFELAAADAYWQEGRLAPTAVRRGARPTMRQPTRPLVDFV